jgi:hypothetical protein
MNLIDFCVSCEPFIFNEKKQILPMCAARFFLLLFSQIWATLHKKKRSGRRFFVDLSQFAAAPAVFGPCSRFPWSLGLGRAKDLVFLGALPSLWWEAVPGLG